MPPISEKNADLSIDSLYIADAVSVKSPQAARGFLSLLMFEKSVDKSNAPVYNTANRIRHCRSVCSVFCYSAIIMSVAQKGKEVQAMADTRALTLTDKKKLEAEVAELVELRIGHL